MITDEKKLKNKAYYEANKERILARNREYNEKHKQEIKAKQSPEYFRKKAKEYYHNNLEACKEKNRNYKQNNKDKVKDYTDRYNADYRQSNKGRKKDIDRLWYLKNKEKIKEKRIVYRLKKVYNLSLDDYEKLLNDQNKNCAICLKPLTFDYVIDHDHRTGKVRGIVHRSCNSFIGLAKEDTTILENSILYLNKHRN